MPRMLWLSPVTFMLWPWRVHCVPSTMELRNPTQVWLKKHRKKFQPSPKPPPFQAVIQQCIALAPEKFLLFDHHMYSNSASYHNKSLQAAMPLDNKGFGIQFQKGGETVLFSTRFEVHAAPFYSQWQWGPKIKRTIRLHLMTRLIKRRAKISLPLNLYDLVIKSAHGQYLLLAFLGGKVATMQIRTHIFRDLVFGLIQLMFLYSSDSWT